MEKRYNPSSNWYQVVEFGTDKLSRKGRKVVKKAESYLSPASHTKNTLAGKAIDLAGRCGPQFAAAFTLGFSRIFNRSLSTRNTTKAIPTMEFDRSQIQATWPSNQTRSDFRQHNR